MAKFTEAQQNILIENARQLYCKGFDAETIATFIKEVSISTIRKWIKDYDFDKSKKSRLLALSEIRNSILESYADLLDGKKPKVKPDEAAKYAAAFEKFSPKKQVLMYMYEAFEMLTTEYENGVQSAKSKKEKDEALSLLQSHRTHMQKVVNNLTNDILGNE